MPCPTKLFKNFQLLIDQTFVWVHLPHNTIEEIDQLYV